MSSICPLFNDEKLQFILNTARENSSLAKQAIQESIVFNQAIRRDQADLLNSNSMLWQKQPRDVHDFQHVVLDRLDQDIQAIKQFNIQLAPIPVSDASAVTWALKTNKMENILVHAKEIIADEKMFSTLVQGHFPAEFSQSPNFPVILGDCETPFGTSQVSYLSAAMIEIHLALLGTEAKVQDIFSENQSTHWVDNAALVHVTHIDKDAITKEAMADFAKSSFYFSDSETEHGFAFVHSGYAFGGQRGEYRYENEKAYGPQDCSSWIAKISGSEVAFSTIDQLFAYRLSQDTDKGYIDSSWPDSEVGKTMQTLFTSVEIEDPYIDIQPGYVMAFRNFESENHLDSQGVSGHTALVLGMLDDDHVLTLGYARDMPKYEGFGLKAFDWQSSSKQDVMFFKVNAPLELADIISSQENLAISNESNFTHCPLIPDHLKVSEGWCNELLMQQEAIVL